MKGAAVKPWVQLGVLEPGGIQGFSMPRIRVWEGQASPLLPGENPEGVKRCSYTQL